jgi:hypothetical protein
LIAEASARNADHAKLFRAYSADATETLSIGWSFESRAGAVIRHDRMAGGAQGTKI